MAEELTKMFITPLLEMWTRFVYIIPNILVSLVFLLVGLTLARFAAALATKLLKKIRLDDHTSKIGLNEIMTRVGFGRSPIAAVAFVLYWSVMLIFIIVAANALNLEIITALLEKFIFFIPKLVVAVVLVFGGLLFARFIHGVIVNSSTANNLRGGAVLAKAAQTAVIVFASIMALEQIGMEMSLITSTLQILIASAGLAFAIAVGLGAKDLVTENLRNYFRQEGK